MAKEAIYKRPLNRVTYANATNTLITVGQVVVVGGRAGIAADDIAPSEIGELWTEGGWEMAAINTAAFDQGSDLYWDAAARKATNSATTGTANNLLIGYAGAAKAKTDAVALVKLRG